MRARLWTGEQRGRTYVPLQPGIQYKRHLYVRKIHRKQDEITQCERFRIVSRDLFNTRFIRRLENGWLLCHTPGRISNNVLPMKSTMHLPDARYNRIRRPRKPIGHENVFRKDYPSAKPHKSLPYSHRHQ